MKRIIIVCLFITALFCCLVTVDAKTNRKSTSKIKSTTTKTFDASVILYKSRGCITPRPGFERTLKQLGFTRKSKDIYVKDGIEVESYSSEEVFIRFNNTEELDKFIDSTKSLGITWQGRECTNPGEFCSYLWVDGNEFHIFVGVD